MVGEKKSFNKILLIGGKIVTEGGCEGFKFISKLEEVKKNVITWNEEVLLEVIGLER